MTVTATASHIDTTEYLKYRKLFVDHLMYLILTIKQSRSSGLRNKWFAIFIMKHLVCILIVPIIDIFKFVSAIIPSIII